jgi:class 3 adenylate cyclase
VANFAEQLISAEGRSEFVIVVVADIRGFSALSTVNESPNIAMFIKRFYLQLINHYFSNATFVKPTGDGLLMTFRYTENNLVEAAEAVLTSCVQLLQEFPTICSDDPMINFAVPQSIGFGVARGTACCLHSGDEILDYSGHLLNLAARLNDLARPSGIVVDGQFLQAVIPESLRENFKDEQVFVRSIAEDTQYESFTLRTTSRSQKHRSSHSQLSTGKQRLTR